MISTIMSSLHGMDFLTETIIPFILFLKRRKKKDLHDNWPTNRLKQGLMGFSLDD